MGSGGDGRASLREIFYVARHSDLSAEELRLWLIYRSYEASDHGGFPGDELLANYVDRSPRSVQSYRASLLENGYLEQELRGPKPARYRAVLPEQVAEDDQTEGSDEGEKEGQGAWPAPSDLDRDGSGDFIYPDEFEAIWRAYPRTKGKKAAYRKVRARIRDGDSPKELLAAAERYDSRMAAEDRELRFVKHASTFFGPDDHWREELANGGPPGEGADDPISSRADATAGIYGEDHDV